MSNVVTKPSAINLEQVLVSGDLSKLTTEQRLSYYNSVCESLGLNPLTRPFEYITLSGKLTFYARKDATDQLRKLNGISIYKIEREIVGDICTVTAYARNVNGKEDADIGAVDIAGLKGERLANAVMKSVTKAKRRVTLSICGLGMLDESEVDSIQEISHVKAAQVNNLLSESPTEIELEPDDTDFLTEAAKAEPPEDLGEYVIPIGQKNKGKRLKDLSPENLRSFVDWVQLNIKNPNADTVEFVEIAQTYLERAK